MLVNKVQAPTVSPYPAHPPTETTDTGKLYINAPFAPLCHCLDAYPWQTCFFFFTFTGHCKQPECLKRLHRMLTGSRKLTGSSTGLECSLQDRLFRNGLETITMLSFFLWCFLPDTIHFVEICPCGGIFIIYKSEFWKWYDSLSFLF